MQSVVDLEDEPGDTRPARVQVRAGHCARPTGPMRVLGTCKLSVHAEFYVLDSTVLLLKQAPNCCQRAARAAVVYQGQGVTALSAL